MLISSVLVGLRIAAGTIAGAVALATVNPALANSSANTDIAAPLRTAQAAKPATGDAQFRQLFNSWETMEKTGVPPLAAVGDAAEAGRVNLVASSRSMPIPAGAFGGLLGRGVDGPARPSIPSRAPIEGFRLTSDFGMRVHPVIGGLRAHKGLDMAAPVGTPVYATADGIVGKAEWFGGYGLFVAIEHGGDLETRYGHMSRLNVAAGQRVHKGDIVGFVGTTGRSTGPHLHYEVRVGGDAVNPIPYMQSGNTARVSAAAVGGK